MENMATLWTPVLDFTEMSDNWRLVDAGRSSRRKFFSIISHFSYHRGELTPSRRETCGWCEQ